MHASPRGIEAQTSSCESREAVQQVESVEREPLSVASHPALPPIVNAVHHASPRIKSLLGKD
jgi:hypothetical protein